MTEENRFIDIRRELHRHPELSGQERWTAGYVEEQLQAFGATKIIRHVGGNGLLAEYFFKGEGPTLLFRADMDAVAVQETDELPYHSRNGGVAHKCGHDGHTTILLRLAKMLHDRPLERGRVLLLFQPAEEDGSGSRAVAETKVLDYYAIDYAFALHNIPGYKTATVVCKPGSFTCAVVSVAIKLTGKTAHAAEPEKGISPVSAMTRIVEELQRRNITDARRDDYFLVTIVEVHAGEEAYGVAAGKGVVRATLRAKTDRVLHEQAKGLKELVAAECERTAGLQHEIEWVEPFSANENNEQAVDLVRRAALRNGLEYAERETPFSWGEDFGLFTGRFRGAMFGLGAGEECPPLHSPEYDFPDELIETGAAMFYSVASLSYTPDQENPQ